MESATNRLHGFDQDSSYKKSFARNEAVQELATSHSKVARWNGQSPDAKHQVRRKKNLSSWSPFLLNSPLNLWAGGRRERARQLGLTPQTGCRQPFELNQSLPASSLAKTKALRNDHSDMGDSLLAKKCTLSKFKGDALNSFSFSPNYQSKRSSVRLNPDGFQRHSKSLSASWAFYNFVGCGSQPGSIFPTTIHNPNKAVVTINAKTTEILVTNKMACALLGINQAQSGKRLCDYLSAKKYYTTLAETQLESNGEVVLISGKVMELINQEKETIPVSVWMRIVMDCEPRCIVVMEPVERAVGLVSFNDEGKILDANKAMCGLHGYETFDEMSSVGLRELMPSIVLPTLGHELTKDMKKQNITGRTRDGYSFPVSVQIQRMTGDPSDCKTPTQEFNDLPLENKPAQYQGVAWAFSNISGLITIFPDGTIHSCNENFSSMLFGYTQNQLVGKNILTLIPSFYEDIDFLDTDSLPLPPLDDDDYEDEADGGSVAYAPGTCYTRPINPIGKQIDLTIEGMHSLSLASPKVGVGISFLRNSSASEPPTRSPSADCLLGGSSSSAMVLPSGSCHAQLNEASSDSGINSLNPDEKLPKKSDMNGNSLTRNEIEEHLDAAAYSLTMKLDLESEQPGTSGFHNPALFRSPSSGSTSSTMHSSSYGGSTDPTEPLQPLTDSQPNEVNSSTPNSTDMRNEKVPRFVLNRFGSIESLHTIPEGSYFGLGMHKDGSDLAIIYQIKKMELADGQVIYCLWVSRDLDEPNSRVNYFNNLTMASSLQELNSISHSLINEKSSSICDSICSSESTNYKDGMDYIQGEYSEKYTTLHEIGKGAFGCVKVGYRNTDKLLIVTKFIRKSKVYDELWVFDSVMSKKVPLEVSLLSTLKHPNIVQVLDVFENDQFFQMVMEKHGSGMDLFEFIDRSPKLDEPLASYIFRQVIAALEYLHSFQIVHRDIKDENIILDEKFHVKLIDFGSATFMSANWCFSTFCGTTEYCSPEVLQGNKYRGPELEMWALGVTLYTLIYGENPFFDVEETIEAELFPPYVVSQSLTHLISWLLHKDPLKRCSLNDAAQHEWTKQLVQPENYKFKDVVRASPEETSPVKYFGGEKINISSSIHEEFIERVQEKNGYSEGHFHRCHSAELHSQSSHKSDTDSSWIEEKDGYS